MVAAPMVFPDVVKIRFSVGGFQFPKRKNIFLKEFPKEEFGLFRHEP
jgi:hypothetical protein